MAGRRKRGSGNSGGTDLEPLHGGMKEVERGRLGPEHHAAADDASAPAERAKGRSRGASEQPRAPYHGTTVPEGGLAPRGEPGQGPTPGPSRGEIEATAGEQLRGERRDLENEGANAPRGRPAHRHDGDVAGAAPRQDADARDPDR